jgi:hypothetical protein
MTAERDMGGATVGGIPVRWAVTPGPAPGGAARRVALFLPFLGGDTGRENVSVRVTGNLGHLAAVRNPDAVDRCLDWLTTG